MAAKEFCLILIFFCSSIYSSIGTFESNMLKGHSINNSTTKQKYNINEINSSMKFSGIANLEESQIVDSIEFDSEYILSLAYGGGYLWANVEIQKEDSNFYCIYKIDVVNKKVVDTIQLLVSNIFEIQSIAYDSTTKGGPYLFFSESEPRDSSIIVSVKKIKIKDYSIELSLTTPYWWAINGMEFKSNSLWLVNDWLLEDSLVIYDLNTKSYYNKFSLPKFVGDISFGVFNNKNILWLTHSDTSVNELFTVNINNGIVENIFTLPIILPKGVCWENKTLGGPYLWVSGMYKSNRKIYKIIDPLYTKVDNIYIFNNLILLPNPFTQSTKIKFNLESYSNVKLSIYNSIGREIAVLADDYLPAGEHEFTFDASGLPPGVYFYSFSAGKDFQSGKVLLIGE